MLKNLNQDKYIIRKIEQVDGLKNYLELFTYKREFQWTMLFKYKIWHKILCKKHTTPLYYIGSQNIHTKEHNPIVFYRLPKYLYILFYFDESMY